jgi:hypothetical protein
MGEGGCIAPAAALAAAVDNAFEVLGPCFASDVPLTSERVARLADEACAARESGGWPVEVAEAEGE